MTVRVARFKFPDNSNQLPYEGTINTYDFDLDTVADVTTGRNAFTITWEELPTTYSPIYAKFRVKSETFETFSAWSIPTTLYLDVDYDVYKRTVGAEATQWIKIETVAEGSAGPYQETYVGEVEYAVCIANQLSQLGPNEGYDVNPFINPYLLFTTGALTT